MTIAVEIQQQINNLNERRERLAGETEQARIAVTEARAALLESDSKRNVEAATTAQSRLTMLDSTVAAVDERITELSLQFDQAEARDARDARFDSLIQHARDADAARHDYKTAQVELNQHMTSLIARLVDAKQRWRTAQMSWMNEAKPLAAGVACDAFFRSDSRNPRELEAEANALIAELETRGANLDSVLAQDVTAKRWLDSTRPYPIATPEPFGVDIERLVLSRMDSQLNGLRLESELRREHPERFNPPADKLTGKVATTRAATK